MMDIDYFKMYNDKNGHIAGDLALIEISRILNAVTRRSDIVSRYGGEEFSVIMPDTDMDSAVQSGENIRKAIEDRPSFDELKENKDRARHPLRESQ